MHPDVRRRRLSANTFLVFGFALIGAFTISFWIEGKVWGQTEEQQAVRAARQ